MTGLLPRHSAALVVTTDAVPVFLDALEPFVESVNAFELDSPIPTDAPAQFSWGSEHPNWATGEAVSLRANWTITAILKQNANRAGLSNAICLAAAANGLPEPELRIEALADTDWLAQLQQDFPPFRLGCFYLYGSHHVPRPGDGPVRLLVNAGTAFGSGEHPTTQGCLLAMQALARKRTIGSVIDMGCGSGILSLAAAKLWRARVIAVDIDAEAARVTLANARLNGVARLIRAGAGNGYAAPILSRAVPVDLVVSNIVARPLKRMAPRLARALKPGGHAILSGLLEKQEAGILAAHRAQGLRLVARHPIGEWRTLVLRK